MRSQRAHRQDAALFQDQQLFGGGDKTIFVPAEISVGHAISRPVSNEITGYFKFFGLPRQQTDVADDPLGNGMRIFGVRGLLAQTLDAFAQVMRIVRDQKKCLVGRSVWISPIFGTK